jgi:hypothetical protein
VPETVQVYALIQDHRISYVGQTYKLKDRLRQHKASIGYDDYVILEEVGMDDDWSLSETKWIQGLRVLGAWLFNRTYPRAKTIRVVREGRSNV